MELKKEIKLRESEIKSQFTVANNDIPFANAQTSIELLDSIMEARDELFDKQLTNGLKSHRKLAGLLMK